MRQWKYLKALQIIVEEQLARVRHIVIILKLQGKDSSVQIKIKLLTLTTGQMRLLMLLLFPNYQMEMPKRAPTDKMKHRIKQITMMDNRANRVVKVPQEVIQTRVILVKQQIQIQQRKVLKRAR